MHKNTLLFNNARVLRNKAGLLENKAALSNSGRPFCDSKRGKV
jgi:hypothetical protein